MTELTIDQALQQGVEAHKAGQVQEADRLYTAILKAQPKHPDANHNMGVLAVGVGKVEQALPFFKTALEADPAQAQFWLSYIDVLIKLGRLVDAKAVLDQARNKGAKGDGFDKLEHSLKKSGQGYLATSAMATEPRPKQPNILDTLKLDQAINLAKRKTKDGSPEEAKRIYQDILAKFPKNKRASDGMKDLVRGLVCKASKVQEPPQDQLQTLINLYRQGQLQQALEQANALLQQFSNSYVLFNIRGIVLKALGQLDAAVTAYTRALAIKPDYAEAYFNIGNAYIDYGQMDEAIEAYKKALAIKPNYAEAYCNMGNVRQNQDRLDEAIEAYKKALAIKPNYAEAYCNMGNVRQNQGRLDEAIEAYRKGSLLNPNFVEIFYNWGNALKDKDKPEEAVSKYKMALAIKSDYTKAYINMGVAFEDQGKVEDAVEAYIRAITVEPTHAEAHRNLSMVKKYKSNDVQISTVTTLLERTDLNNSDLCSLHYTYAKMKDDLGDLSRAFNSYVEGGALRKKLLAYDITQDQTLFIALKNSAPKLDNTRINLSSEVIRHTPIFIVGMPRSGTTLVEQILSCHTKIIGLGELEYVEKFGKSLAVGQIPPDAETIKKFRECYLRQITKRADGQPFITDKMPTNFKYIALICAAFPEAKIIHVHRSAEATCWSNFKHYFTSHDLGYSYNLEDTVNYYNLYKGLMRFWHQSKSYDIYNLDYDNLTENQELDTRALIKHLGLNWEDACLAPHLNKRSVNTASKQQVRQTVYKGSSQAWKNYELFLDSVFDRLDVS